MIKEIGLDKEYEKSVTVQYNMIYKSNIFLQRVLSLALIRFGCTWIISFLYWKQWYTDSSTIITSYTQAHEMIIQLQSWKWFSLYPILDWIIRIIPWIIKILAFIWLVSILKHWNSARWRHWFLDSCRVIFVYTCIVTVIYYVISFFRG